MEPVEFFNLILPAAGLRCMAVATPGRQGFKHVFGDTNEWLAKSTQYVDQTRPTSSVYYACASYKPKSEWAEEYNEFGKQKERTGRNVAYVRSFWADMDVGPEKPYATQREAAAAVLGFSLRLGLRRPWIVSSGAGLHAYWPIDHDMLPDVWGTTARLFKAALKAEGVHADPSRTADSASVLRPPGTTHRKRGPRPVRVLVQGDVSTLSEFQHVLLPYAGDVPVQAEAGDNFLPEGGPASEFDARNSDLTAGVEYRPASGRRIADECGIIGMLRDTGGAVDQPTWYFGLGVLAYTEEGDALCHEWSSGDARYSKAETDRKLAQIRANQKPTTCTKLGEQHPTVCAACPHNGKIKTPYTLGLQNGETVQIEERVKTATGGWTTRVIQREAPPGFRYTQSMGRTVMQHAVLQETDEDGEKRKKGDPEQFLYETFCDTLVMPITRLWIEGVAHVECEMDLKDGEKRRFVIEGGIIGKGKDTLAAEMARNEVVCKPGKGRAMDSYMSVWMQKLKEEADQVVAHRHFGWEDRSFVLGDSVLHPDGSESRAILVGMAKSKGPSVSTSGDLQTWVSLVDRAYNAPGQEGFQFLVANAFAAPLLSMMKQVSGVTVYAHSEGSGVGKTTAQRVGLSAWGNWDELMLADAKVTQNALWGLMGAYNTLPIVFDELTNTENRVCSELVFSVSSGRSKQRMAASGELRENNSNWCTILMASGNNLLSEKLSLHRGNAEAEISRLFEFTLEATPHLSPNEANALFPKISEHYGHAGRLFASYIVTHYDDVQAMLLATQDKLNTQLGITRVERYWSALLASSLVAVALCRNLGLLQFDLAGLKSWMIARLRENRVQRNAATNSPLELFGGMLSDLWQGVLVTQGEGDIRRGVAASVIQPPRGAMVGRAILPADKFETPVLMLNAQSVKDWSNKKGVSAREIFKAAVEAGWADAEEVRYSLGKGTLEYSQTSSYLRCWKLHPDRIGIDAGAMVAKKLGVLDGGKAASAGVQ